MKMIVVSIFDQAAGVHSQPLYFASKGLAVRAFQDECRRAAPDNNLNKHPEDFALYELAVYDDSVGHFEQNGGAALLFRGSDCK